MGLAVTFEAVLSVARNQCRRQLAEPSTELPSKHQRFWEQREEIQPKYKSATPSLHT